MRDSSGNAVIEEGSTVFTSDNSALKSIIVSDIQFENRNPYVFSNLSIRN